MNKVSKFFASIAGCELVGVLATPFTINAIPTWYATLTKPPFSPPNWIFGPVWTILYFLMGVAFYKLWIYKPKKKEKRQKQIALRLFCAQLFFNFIWSWIFFGIHSPLFALLDIVILLYLIVLTTKAFFKLSQTAGILMLPYLLWVFFATFLNAAIVLLNP
jgi:translocator protein